MTLKINGIKNNLKIKKIIEILKLLGLEEEENKNSYCSVDNNRNTKEKNLDKKKVLIKTSIESKEKEQNKEKGKNK